MIIFMLLKEVSYAHQSCFYLIKNTVILQHIVISLLYYHFYSILNQINSALVSIKELLQKHKKTNYFTILTGGVHYYITLFYI